MARIFPTVDQLHELAVPLNIGERQVFDALTKLDDSWLIYVQPRLGLDQPDFIAMHADFGVTAIEVKDWSLGCYRQDDQGIIEVRSGGGWRKTGEAPRYQAHRYRDTIFNRFFAAEGTPIRDFALVRAVVVLPRHTTDEARALLAIPRMSKASEDRVRVFGGHDVESDPLTVVTGYRRPRPMVVPRESLTRLRRHIAEAEARNEQRLPLKLNATALNIEQNRSGARIRRVKGAAGSGKSLGLAARAARLSAEDKDVLVVTYNSTLPHYLHDLAKRRCRENGASMQRITFVHLHGLCSRVIEDARIAGFEPVTRSLPGTVPEDDALVDLASDAYEQGYGPRFDAVLVDEGQDFSLAWWNFLRHRVRREGGEMLLVADPTQDLYAAGLGPTKR